MIELSLSSDVHTHHGHCDGTYKLKGVINEHTYWLRTDQQRAIWFIPEFEEWAIGYTAALGTSTRLITSLWTDDNLHGSVKHVSECPYDEQIVWAYWNQAENNWKNTDHVNIKCQGIW